VIPVFHQLMNDLQRLTPAGSDSISELRSNLSIQLHRRYDQILKNPYVCTTLFKALDVCYRLYRLATLVDPRFLTAPFNNRVEMRLNERIAAVEQRMQREVDEAIVVVPTPVSVQSTTQPSTSLTDPGKLPYFKSYSMDARQEVMRNTNVKVVSLKLFFVLFVFVVMNFTNFEYRKRRCFCAQHSRYPPMLIRSAGGRKMNANTQPSLPSPSRCWRRRRRAQDRSRCFR
jgi:hypothetical protein